MLIQVSSPRPMVTLADSPPFIRIQTLKKAGVSTGDVALVMGENRMEVDPYCVYPIDGESGFEALDFYLPFWRVFGTQKAVYDEAAIAANIQRGSFKRVSVGAPDYNDRLTDTKLALLGAGGYHIIAKSAHRLEGAVYAQRVFNFTIHCPVTGGGMIRIAGSPVDIANPTFDPKAKTPEKSTHADPVLLEAFNRTHRLRTPEIEERKRQRIAEAEASVRALEGVAVKPLPALPDPADPQRCPECKFLFGEHEEDCSKPAPLPPRKRFPLIRKD